MAIEGGLRQERMETSELAVDTHGHTDFAMSHVRLLGFDLCPCLKALKQRHLFLPHGVDISPEIAVVCEASVNTDLVEKHWDTLVHLAASVMSGINLRGLFRFPVERCAADLMPSLAPPMNATIG